MIEFLTVWGSGGVSTLYLTCVSGQVNVVFSCSLYDSTIKPAPLAPPQAPPPSSPGDTRECQPHHHPKHHPHPPLLPRQLRCRGPADKERSRRRAAKTSSSNRQFLPLALFLSPAPPSSPGCHTVRSPSHSPPPTFFQPHPRHQGVGQTCHQATLHQHIFSQLHPRHPTLLLKSGATAEDHPDSGAGAARAGSRGP